ncbi:MAG: methyltransferase domain-containing protein [Deltaproteobacteria bacterium]|nr:methyltransferase domain-containing protein [Deltaproteobacteria bacterium]
MNEDPAAYWNDARGWVRAQDSVDQWLSPITAQLIEATAAAAGERAVDVGCGCGGSTLPLAERVGPQGRVLGVDISAVMLDHGRTRTKDVEQVELVLADATEHPFEPGWADLVISRFGVMFFLDPVRAFSNIRAGMRPGGRLCMAVWQGIERNEWINFIMQAFPELESPVPDADAGPGPFSFSDPARVVEVLGGAGFSAIEPVPFTTSINLGDSVDLALETMSEVGPLSRVLAEAEEDQRPQLLARARAFLQEQYRTGPPLLEAAVWIVHARA